MVVAREAALSTLCQLKLGSPAWLEANLHAAPGCLLPYTTTGRCKQCPQRSHLHQWRIEAAVREGADGARRVKAADPHAQLAAVLGDLAGCGWER